MWVGHVDEAIRSILAQTIRDLGFPVLPADLDGIESTVYDNLSWNTDFDLNGLEAGTVIVSVIDRPAKDTIVYAKEIQAALAKSVDFPVAIVWDGDTVPGGAVVTVKP